MNLGRCLVEVRDINREMYIGAWGDFPSAREADNRWIEPRLIILSSERASERAQAVFSASDARRAKDNEECRLKPIIGDRD